MNTDVIGPDAMAEELDSRGYGTGVEAETEDDLGEPDIHDPFDPEKIDVVTKPMTVDLLLSRIRRHKIDLQPDFQRRAGIWTMGAKSRLIESLLLRIPLPTLYAAEYTDDDGDESWAIVDGIQRLTTITEFVEAAAIGESPLRLHDLEYLPYGGFSFDELPGRLQTRLRESELIVHVIRRGTPEPVKFNIFARINTGGLPLSAQELRHALIPGPARDLLKAWAQDPLFRTATGGSVKSDRMADREMILRFLAFSAIDPNDYGSQDFDKFLRDTMRDLNSASEHDIRELAQGFRSAMDSAARIFGPYAFRKRSLQEAGRKLPLNKALFESVSVNLAALSSDRREDLVRHTHSIEKRFLELMDDTQFMVAISQGTGDVGKVRLRFKRIRELFEMVTK
jgi:uncharacterized protein DUF262